MTESYRDVLERMRKDEERNSFTREQAIKLIEGYRDRHVLFCERHYGDAALAKPVVDSCNHDIDIIRRGGMISIVSYAWQGAKVVDDVPEPGDVVRHHVFCECDECVGEVQP